MAEVFGANIMNAHVSLTADEVNFTVVIRNAGREWKYRGVAMDSALEQLGDGEPVSVLEQNATKILDSFLRSWREQPETYQFVIDDETVSTFGTFVNNG
ncbi:hypothetical protein PAQ31011_00645 [Pandoraea aquatica]|uniref:Uncharacterized protein n=1 Tax=Pandoraea aquatica TaxID=2508290 RepID=A0A5E4S9B2_9BURK|nr:hypothetical protein [Pandoraea aquatica]VVD71731.1 hypothetical protein PAQ31011_00645 [Pandoraea aquatica]